MAKPIKVVAAAIIKGSKVLAVQRSGLMTLSGFWEFPGGKIEPGETEIDALEREIREELTVEIEVKDYVNSCAYTYNFGKVILTVYTAEITAGSIRLLEHSAMKWLDAHELKKLDWTPVNVPATKIIARKLVNKK